MTNKQSQKAGLPPGSLVHIGEQRIDAPRIGGFQFTKDDFSQKEYDSIDDYQIDESPGVVNWLNIVGIHDADLIKSIGDKFGLHSLLQEDVLDTTVRPKIEEYDNCLFISLKIVAYQEDGESLEIDQISFVLGTNWLISFQEVDTHLFSGLLERTKNKRARTRERGPDYLLFRLLDIVVDHYFFIIEASNDLILNLEEEVIDNVNSDVRTEIIRLKKQLISFKKMVFPLREKLSYFNKDSNDYIKESSVRYFADVHENVKQILDALEAQREMLNNVMDLYQAGEASKTNQVMQLLTVISTIFIPLTFIAGVYGMNFANMPELNHPYGYFITLIVMVLIMIGMLFYFKRKKWL